MRGLSALYDSRNLFLRAMNLSRSALSAASLKNDAADRTQKGRFFLCFGLLFLTHSLFRPLIIADNETATIFIFVAEAVTTYRAMDRTRKTFLWGQ